MDEISLRFIQIFEALRQPDNNVIQQATSAAQELLKLPNSINSLLQIILNPPNIIYKSHASVFLGMYMDIHAKEIQDPNPIIQQLFQIIQNENDYEAQRLMINAIEKLINNDTIPVILQFAQNSLQSGQLHLLNASILLCIAIGTELDKLSNYYPLFINLITVGLEKLPPMNSIDFAFLLGNIVNDPNVAFFRQVWDSSINLVIQNLNDFNLVNFITSKLNESMDSEDYISPFVNPAPILQYFLPLLGSQDIDLEVNLCLLSTVALALDIDGVLDNINVEEFFPSLMQKLFQISALAYNPNDSLSISNVDVFEDFCIPFSSSDLDTSDIFIEVVLSLVKVFYNRPETKPGMIIALGYIVGEPSDIILDSLQQICQIFAESVNNESRLVRDSAAFAIIELSSTYEDEIEDYIESLAIAIFQSLTKEITQDMLEAFKNLLMSALDTDPIFDQTYPFLMQKMSTSHENWLSYYFPCLTELCVHSQKKVQNVFPQLVPLLFNTLKQNSSENMIEESVKCLSTLSTSSPELFAQYVQPLVEYLLQYLKSNNETLVIVSLLSFGKLMENHSQLLSPILPQLYPVLLEIGAKDSSGELLQDIVNYQNHLKMLQQNGETEFDVGDGVLGDESDEKRLSKHAIPSLALSVYSAIAMNFPEIIPSTLQRAISEIGIQMKNCNQDAMEETCKAISLLSRGVVKAQIPVETKTQVAVQFCKWMVMLINMAVEVNSATEAMQATGLIIQLFGAAAIGAENQASVMNIIKEVLEGNLKCQKGSKDYMKEFHEQFCALVGILIASLGNNAPTVLGSLITIFYNLATSKNQQYRDIAIQVLGQLVQHSSAVLQPNDKANIYKFVINGIRQNSQHAAFALSQFTNNDGAIIMENIQPLLNLLHEKLQAQNKKKAASYVAFIDNLVAAIGEIWRNVLKDQFPIQQFALLCLSAMPAKIDPSINLEMMNFYVWMANVMNMQPINEFAAVAVKLFMVPRTEIGGIAEDDSGILQKVAAIMVNCLNAMGPNAAQFVATICDNDQFKIQRVQDVIKSVQV